MKNLKKIVFVSLLIFCSKVTFSQSYWIKDNFTSHGTSSSYSTFEIKTLPFNVFLNCVNSNVESADGDCNGQGNSLRIKVDGGYVEFTVPDAGRVRIGLKAKSSNANRIMKVYKNGILDSTFSGLDANHCAEYLDTVKTISPVTYKITSENTGPGVVSYIHVHKYTEGEIVDEDPYIVNEYNINNIWINEVVPSNIDGLIDDTWDFPDSWVEFYNSSNSDSNLLGWKLAAANGEWIIPVDCIVPAKGYKIVYLDEKNVGLHAPFRLDVGGDLVTLMRTDGTVEDKMPAKFNKNMPPNNSYGRVNDSVDLWGWFLQATPEKTNNTSQVIASDQIAPNVIFSVKGGTYKTAQSIILSLPQNAPSNLNETNIYYTTDGSEPIQHSNQYTGAISLDTTTVIRAKVISSDYLPKLSVSQTYIIENRNFDLPVISLTLNPEYLWDDTIGIYTDGKNGVPTCWGLGNKNYQQDWRRPMNFEYYNNRNELNTLNQVGEIRIGGGCSRTLAQKTFIVYGNKRFGEKRYKAKFFGEKDSKDKDGGYKSFMLRNSGNDFNITQFRDAFLQYLLAGKVDIDYQAYQPSSVFINGKYWGILNIRERSDEDFVLYNYSIEDIDLLENGVLKVGNMDSYNELFSILSQDTLKYKDINQKVDINEYLNYYILQLYIANTDWPENNMVMWRDKNNGKWRWILKDLDVGFGFWEIPDMNMIDFVTKTRSYNQGDTNTDSSSTVFPIYMFNKMLSLPDFQEQFINTFSIYLGDLFHKQEMTQLIDKFSNNIANEMVHHKERWGGTIEDWKMEIERMKNWGLQRNDYVYEHLKQFFNLGNPIPTKIYSSLDSENGKQTIVINDVPVHRNYFEGKQFQKRQLKISIKDTSENKFVGWRIKEIINGKERISYYADKEIICLIDSNCTHFEAFAAMNENLPQTILWEQDTNIAYTNQPIELNAIATSGLGVKYVLVDTTNAVIVDNVLIVKKPGPITIIVEQEGDLFFSKAQPLTKTFNIQENQEVILPQENILNFEIYPNPSINGYFWIESSEEGILSISNLKGQKLLSQTVEVGKNYVDISNFSKGVFIGVFKTTKKNIHFKLVKY